jgi:ketosteroid isomerase-like protein
MSPRNADVVRRFYGAMNAADMRAITSVVDPDFEWIPAEGSPFDEAYRGREQVKRFFEQEWIRAFDDLHSELRQLIEAPGGVVVARVHLTGRGKSSGVEVAIDIAHLWTLRDGIAVQCRAYPKVEKALEAAGLEGLPANSGLEKFDS